MAPGYKLHRRYPVKRQRVSEGHHADVRKQQHIELQGTQSFQSGRHVSWEDGRLIGGPEHAFRQRVARRSARQRDHLEALAVETLEQADVQPAERVVAKEVGKDANPEPARPASFRQWLLAERMRGGEPGHAFLEVAIVLALVGEEE